MTMHTCSYYCERPDCIRAQRDELRQKLEQAEKQWVGLTDEEIGGLTVFDGLTHIEVPILVDFVRAIEVKLKEKNCSAVNNS